MLRKGKWMGEITLKGIVDAGLKRSCRWMWELEEPLTGERGKVRGLEGKTHAR